jgi:hypothetical protein
MMVRTFTEHFGTTRRARRFLARNTLLMFYACAAPGTDTESPLPHIVPALLYHLLLLVLRNKKDCRVHDGKAADRISTSKYVMIPVTSNSEKMRVSHNVDVTTAP